MKIFASVQAGLVLVLLVGVTYGQAPPPITSSGLNTQVSVPVIRPDGAVQHNITGGTRPGGGANLFHSFGEFGVPTDNIANFLNDSGLPTTNILSRVTGGNPSNILGTIQTDGFGNANLFLMNPAGIVFGPNASLSVGGATHFTTADYLRLADGVKLTALPSAQDALLSIAPVAAFGFLEGNPAPISVEGNTLSVAEGQALSLVGGDIAIGNSSLNAPGGKVVVASLASPGEVVADTFASAPNVNGQSFTTMGDISLLERTTLDVSGKPAGTVIIRGGQLLVDGSTISANIMGPSGGLLEPPGAGIDIQVTGDLLVDNKALIQVNVLEGSMAGKDIILNIGQNLEIRNESIVQTLALGGSGNAGNIEVYADKVLISGGFRSLESLTFGTFGGNSTVNAGNISITAMELQMVGGGITATTVGGVGQGGNVNVNVQEGEISLDSSVISTNAFGSSGNAGEVKVVARNLSITNDSNIESTSTSGAMGNAGRVNVVVEGQLDIRERSAITVRSELAEVNGDLTIRAEDIVITGIREGMFPLDGQQRDFTGLSTRTIDGKGGDMYITAGNLQVVDDGIISASSSGTGNAGNIHIIASDTILLKQSTVNTESKLALGGNIKLTADNRILLTDSQVTSRVQEGSGNAGSINLDPDFIVLKNSKVLSTAISGDGGPIKLTANSAILVDQFSNLDARSQFGGNGTIDIQAPTKFLSGTIAPLPQNPAPVTALYGTRCVAGASGHFSTFVDSKADSLAPMPGTFLASPFLPPSSSPHAKLLATAEPSSNLSEPGHATPIQVAAYSPPVLFGQDEGILSACP